MQTSRQRSRGALIAAVLVTMLLAACGGGGGDDTLTTITPIWSAEVDSLDTFETHLEQVAQESPRPAVIDAAGFAGAKLNRICLVAHRQAMQVLNDGGVCQ